MRVAIYGVGGIGGVLGARLVRAGQEVVFIARGKQLQAIRERGLRIEHASDPFEVGPVAASDRVADFEPVDLVVLCVKAWQVEEACEGLRPLLHPGTGVLTLQNGVDAPETVAKRLGVEHAMPGLIRIISYVLGPGVVRDNGFPPQIMFGEHDGSSSARTDSVIEAMAGGGIEAIVPESIETELWRKLLFIASTSAVGAVTRVSFGAFLGCEQSRELLRQCQREIVRVAQAAGVALDEGVVDATMAFTDGLPPSTTASMQRDIMERRPSELFDQTGAIVRAAERFGVDAPVNRALLGALRRKRILLGPGHGRIRRLRAVSRPAWEWRMDRISLVVGGESVETREWIDVVEPATGHVYAQVADAEAADVGGAVRAARAAFDGWSNISADERSRMLMRLADLIDRDVERLAAAESRDTGKPLSVARTVDIPRCAHNFRFFAGAILHNEGSFHDMGGEGFNYTLRRPRGVAGLISPWNLPLYLLTWKIAPAIATGNTCVCKPSEMSPMSAHLLMDLVHESGIPAGVVNMVHGRGDRAGAAIVEHPDVPAISFTGSTRAGSWIAQHAGAMLKRYSLELGGKNPNLVFADADLDVAIETSVRAAYSNQGQICLCGSRILVERSVYQGFVERFAERARGLRIGDPLDEATQIGSLIGREHLKKVDGLVRLAENSGGTVVCGGGPAAAPNERCAGGAFYEPTVITGLDSACETEQEEIFGPVVTITPFDDEEHALKLANCTRYGLASMIWTRDLGRAHRVAEGVDAGIVWVNCWMLRDLRTPFGGTKQSGVGREGGLEALRFFTEPKNVCIGR